VPNAPGTLPDNLGVPRNPENPVYGMDDVMVDGVPINPLGDAFVDEGLGGFVRRLASNDDWRNDPHVTAPLRTTASADLLVLASANRGKQKVPTLRNVDRRPEPGAIKARGDLPRRRHGLARGGPASLSGWSLPGRASLKGWALPGLASAIVRAPSGRGPASLMGCSLP
jgi:hypothetical protein